MLNYHWTLILVSFGLFKYFFLFVFHSLSIFQFSDILRICNLPFFFFSTNRRLTKQSCVNTQLPSNTFKLLLKKSSKALKFW